MATATARWVGLLRQLARAILTLVVVGMLIEFLPIDLAFFAASSLGALLVLCCCGLAGRLKFRRLTEG